jgi:transposase InsO family protein
MAVTKHQVRVYMSARKQGLSQVAAAAKAGIGERTARRVEKRGVTCGKAGPRSWRTREDPFAAVWETELVPMLKQEPGLQAITLLEWIQERDPIRYPDSLLRTLQRRVKQWRALEGPEREVMFRQRHEPGHWGISDFTRLKRVSITLGGKPFPHLLYHFRLAYSGWCDVKVIRGGESYPALAEGLQQALIRLGGVPEEHRTDSLSAAFKNLTEDEKKDITKRYKALCEHYGMVASRNNPGRGHENGSIESPHGHLKRRIRQALLIRGSNDFATIADYQTFLDTITATIRRRNRTRIEAELPTLRPLPATPAVDYTEVPVRVSSSATIHVRRGTYTVPSRLIGERLTVHLFDDRLELYHGTTAVLTLRRVYPASGVRRARCIDYRHLIGWLARKPMALQGLQFRDDLWPSEDYRELWHRLNDRYPPRQACKLMVGALKLAADQDCEQELATYWQGALAQDASPTLADLQSRFATKTPPVASPPVHQHDLASYDALLPGGLHG